MDNRNQIELIKEKIDAVEFIGKYVQLKQAGRNFSGLCPFHGEKTPSFMVSPEIQRYKCFGCGESGDIFNFIQKIENIDFPEALEKLAKEAGVTLEKTNKNPKIDRMYEINKDVANFFYKELFKKENAKALTYLTETRGFSLESIKKFGLGFTNGKNMLQYINKRYGFQERDMGGEFTQLGLISWSVSRAAREKFFNRAMFPIRSTTGKVIGFSGRVLPDDKYGPKYMNTPETPIFHKKENLYGLYESRQEIRKLDLAIICEGQTDVISAHQAGIENIVAPLGTALTKEQLDKLSRYTKNFLFLFDSDEAGQKAMERAFKLSSEIDANPYAANPSPYKDLDELIQKELNKLKKLIEKPRDAFTYLLTEYLKTKNLSNYSDYNKTLNYVKDLLESVKNTEKQNFYRSKVNSIAKIPLKELAVEKTNPSEKKQVTGKILEREREFVRILMQITDISKLFDIEPNIFLNENYKKIISYILENPKNSKAETISHFQNIPELQSLIEDLIFEIKEDSKEDEEYKETLEEIYKYINQDYIKRKSKELNVKIAIAEEEKDMKKLNNLLSELQELNNYKKENG